MAKHEHDDERCPHCGACKHCGAPRVQYVPYPVYPPVYPYGWRPYPTYPQYPYTVTYGIANQTTSGLTQAAHPALSQAEVARSLGKIS